MYQIEKGVPLAKSGSKYPFSAMSVNDSFFVPGEPALMARRVQTCAWQFKRANDGTDFEVHRIQGDTPGARCWRVR